MTRSSAVRRWDDSVSIWYVIRNVFQQVACERQMRWYHEIRFIERMILSTHIVWTVLPILRQRRLVIEKTWKEGEAYDSRIFFFFSYYRITYSHRFWRHKSIFLVKNKFVARRYCDQRIKIKSTDIVTFLFIDLDNSKTNLFRLNNKYV
jgi:hypothetical protein